ncbi:MAG: hypothetical protein SFY66_20335 [Oculatellaceae cyanobacterium bins.114]|nr:hypothetical protein [Oculatellaceae cyanobacterium bins.114]
MKSYSASFHSTIKPSNRSYPKSASTHHWSHRWQRFLDAIAGYSEPHIWQESNQRGEVFWRAYDPVNDRYFSGTENDMRLWIEQRYYA